MEQNRGVYIFCIKIIKLCKMHIFMYSQIKSFFRPSKETCMGKKVFRKIQFTPKLLINLSWVESKGDWK